MRRKWMFRKKLQDKWEVDSMASNFGLVLNGDVTCATLQQSRKRNLTYAELEKELNKLACYVFDGKRTVGFHEFRQFPYIFHGDISRPETLSSEQLAGLAKAYTSADVYFVRFIKKFLRCSEGPRYSFPSIEYIKNNSSKVEIRERPISDMAIDELIK